MSQDAYAQEVMRALTGRLQLLIQMNRIWMNLSILYYKAQSTRQIDIGLQVTRHGMDKIKHRRWGRVYYKLKLDSKKIRLQSWLTWICDPNHWTWWVSEEGDSPGGNNRLNLSVNESILRKMPHADRLGIVREKANLFQPHIGLSNKVSTAVVDKKHNFYSRPRRIQGVRELTSGGHVPKVT